VTCDHRLDWRIGRKLTDPHHGAVTIYDGCPDGDGGEPGHFIGTMFDPELARRVVEAVNRAAPYGDLSLDELAERAVLEMASDSAAHRVGPLLSAEELATMRRWLSVGRPSSPGRRILAHIDASADVAATQNAYMADRDGRVKELASTVVRLRGLLDEWGRHACDCPAYEWSGTEPACTCGWAEVEGELAGKEEPPPPE
jgi:hypothetical protein